MAICPGCEADIDIDDFDVDVGYELPCPECGEDVRVTNLSPIELELVSDEDDEDEDSYDDDEEEVTDDEDGDDWDE